ncbi:hypothetical protein FACS1894111_12150 [Clostridia bacterium]|nr:hypothetical protein FACS1894111_12150 [Clostridia bacterium]
MRITQAKYEESFKQNIVMLCQNGKTQTAIAKEYGVSAISQWIKQYAEVQMDKVNQQFNLSSPNCVWVSDITYIKVGGKWCYVCVFIDLFSRKIARLQSQSQSRCSACN